MHWLNQDWEHPNDEIYAIERQMDIEVAWQKWEEEQERNKRLPAIIIVETPITKDETKRNTRTIRRAHQTQL